MNLQEIVKQWLVDHGYDGLYNADGECACDTGDIMTCDEPGIDCQPGYKVECPKGYEYDFIITPNKNQTNCEEEEE